MNVRHIKKFSRSRLKRFFIKIRRNSRQTAVNDDQFRVNLFNRQIGFLQKLRVCFRIRSVTPETREILLIPNFPIANLIFKVRYRPAHVLQPGFRIAIRRCGPRYGIIQNRENRYPLFLGRVHYFVKMLEMPRSTRSFDSAPGKVRACPFDSRLTH